MKEETTKLVNDIKDITQEIKVLEDLVSQNDKMTREDLKKFIVLCNLVGTKFKIWKMDAVMSMGIKEEGEKDEV